MTIQAILFDKDGTLIDFAATFGPATDRVLSALAGDNSELCHQMADAVGYTPGSGRFNADSVLIAGSLTNIANALLPLMNQTDLPGLTKKLGELYDVHSLETLAPFPFLIPTLDALAAAGLPLGIATNDAEQTARAHMHKIGITERFAYVAGYDSGHGEKPGPGMITAFATHLDLPAHQIAMIGDSIHDLKAAKAAGARRIAVTTGLASADVLTPHADHVLNNISELPDLIATLNSVVQ